MKRILLLAVALLLVSVASQAQDFSAWPNVIVGAQYVPADQPGARVGPAKFRALLTANVVGPHAGPCAVGGSGFAFGAQDSGSIDSLAFTIPLVTCYKGIGLVQVGVSQFLQNGGSHGFYAGVGFSKAAQAVAKKRAARKAAAAKPCPTAQITNPQPYTAALID